MKRPFLWAHRGVSRWTPENTMAAFAAAVTSGADGIELDLHLSSDGVPVVIHDETLERTTDGRGPVAEMTLHQLQQLDAGSWFSPDFAGEPIPTLDNVLATFGGQLRLNLEIKAYSAGVAVLELLRHYPNADILISSFDLALLKRLRAMDESLSLAALYEAGNWRRAVEMAVDFKASAFHPGVTQTNRSVIQSCGRAGLPVSVWAVDDVSVAKSLVRAGVTGLFSNDPSVLDEAFSRSWLPG